ncbi:SAM-dependent methyltransferase [Actinomadura chibensis]|uniref:SAM-dependent methyltransferase n=1 Tax=Actinomadura chibensis TaxID=392828 RepID=A0A5D0NMS5_9ACTN|nr:SAM-dependent methyltransferase [Actinomadura chibensis]TYB45589.1 SAM-dependent methyltransferase [Actinomadura chibensis]
MRNLNHIGRPTIARTYDYLLGGKDNFACDRDLASQLLEVAPHIPDVLRAARRYRQQVVRYLAAECGIRQFLDFGIGIPMLNGNVHQIAQRINPGARVVYVDNDPVALAHGRALLAQKPGTAVVEGDLRKPRQLLDHPAVGDMIDFSRPVAVIMHSVLEFIAAEHDPHDIVAEIRRAIRPGSYLTISHLVSHPQTRESANLCRLETAEPMTVRSLKEIAGFLSGLNLVPPGLAPVTRFSRPSRPSEDVWLYGALATSPDR